MDETGHSVGKGKGGVLVIKRPWPSMLRTIWGDPERFKKTYYPEDFKGQFYTFDVMTPFFNPGPIQHPKIPIYIAAVNPLMCRIAGELCEGMHVHPFNSPKYLREVVHPAVEEGLRRSGRSRRDFTYATATFVDTTTSTTLCSSPVSTGGTASCTYNAAAPGTYQVKVNVGGRYTGTTGADTTLTVTATTTPPPVVVPETTLTSGPGAWLLDTAATYGYSSSLPGSTFTCGFDGAPAPCAPPTTWTGLPRRAATRSRGSATTRPRASST